MSEHEGIYPDRCVGCREKIDKTNNNERSGKAFYCPSCDGHYCLCCFNVVDEMCEMCYSDARNMSKKGLEGLGWVR